MATSRAVEEVEDGDVYKVKIICLGDSAVGKSKLVERFLMNGYQPRQQSTYALTRFKYSTKFKGKPVEVGKIVRTRGLGYYSSVSLTCSLKTSGTLPDRRSSTQCTPFIITKLMLVSWFLTSPEK
eukprot:m.56695 g.56695  ORF g.56695 m.56695 type:complete len:125 (+) comp34631_c0_seq10:38-412(+)